MWAGFVVVSGCRAHFIALARLEFPPLEIFAQRTLQPLLPRALGRPRALPLFAVRLVRHLQVARRILALTVFFANRYPLRSYPCHIAAYCRRGRTMQSPGAQGTA